MHPKRQQYKFLDMLKTLTDKPLRGNFTALQIEVLNYVAKNNIPEGTKFSGVPGHARYGSSSCTTLVVQNDERTVEVNFSLNSNSSTPLPLCAKKIGINPKGEPKPTEPKPETPKIETKKDENMKQTTTPNGLLDPLVEYLQNTVITELQAQIDELKKNATQSTILEVKTPKSTTKIEGLTHKVFPDALSYLCAGENLYFFGPAGSGKNVICEQLAKALNVDFYYQNTILTKFDLSGYVDANGKYQNTPFYEAWTKGGLIMFDELDNSTAEAIIALNAALANGYFTFPNCGKVKKHENFYCVAAGNTNGLGATEEYCGRFQMDESSRDRFIFLSVDYDTRIEKALCDDDAQILEFVHDLRDAAQEAQIHIICGYRLISRLYKFREMNITSVLNNTLIKGLPNDNICEIVKRMKHQNNPYTIELTKISK